MSATASVRRIASDTTSERGNGAYSPFDNGWKASGRTGSSDDDRAMARCARRRAAPAATSRQRCSDYRAAPTGRLSSRFEGAGEEPQLGVAGEHVEVPVGVEQVEVGSDGHRSDEAVGERSSRVAGSTGLPVDRGGCALEIVEAPRRHELAPSKQLPQPIRMGVVPERRRAPPS